MLDYLNEIGLKFYFPEKETLYKYVSLETAQKILENNTLKFSNSDEFNDPFELSTDFIDFKFSEKELKEFINRKLDNQTRSERRRIYKNNYKKPENLIQILKDTLNKQKREIGICCFSKNYKNTVMWSHYSDKHKGICLGLKMDQGDNFFIMHVKYIKELKSIRYWEAREKIFPNWVFTKSHVWEYEEEIRAIYLQQNGIIHFDQNCLKDIYYGLRTSQSEIDSIEQIINHRGYKIQKRYKMDINSKEYNLIAKEII